MQLAVLDLKVVLVGRNVLVDADLWLGCAMVLNFHFKIERCDSFQGDGNDFLTF